ncbi:tetratricopeptide repeat protein [Rubritalea spongiae]|uniref:Tetratricopeptide repeat protein n=1 Tax=Rubritalea spongiae TaxID=430797 RepID=A0ABW5DXW4_9BACT
MNPVDRPSVSKPSVKPGDRPSASRPSRPATRPSVKPGDSHYSKPSLGIDGRPLQNRPGGGASERPSVRPKPGDGIASRPSPPGAGGSGNRPKPGNRPSSGKPINKPPIGDRVSGVGKPGLPKWDNRPGVGHRPGRGGNVNVGNKVDVNFSRNVNWSVDSRHWGGRPWWGAGSYYPWHGGHWHYGYHYRPYYYPAGRAIAWGLVGWGLGNLIFDCGYYHYFNPYPTQTVVVYTDGGQSSNLSYAEPVGVSAEQTVEQRSDMSQEESDTMAKKASDAFEAARVAFKSKDYVTASKKTDEAISYDPGDTVQHEFKGLCLFALQKYADAASVLNSVLAGSPGWGWETMIGQYDSSATYEAQLRALEDYAKKSPKAAEAQFLLGYHYMTAGHLDEASEAFAKCVELQPRDQVAQQLLELTENSTTGDGDDSDLPTDSKKEYNPPPLDSMHGKWTAKTPEGTIVLIISDDDKFVWSYDDGKKPFKMEGGASMDEGLLVLSDDDSQIVAAVEMKDDSTLNFIVAGGAEGDPGVDFNKS